MNLQLISLSGYNTTQALKILPKIIPNPEYARIRIMVHQFFLMEEFVLVTRSKVILFGSNDACFSETQNGQHVPLDEYKQNLVKILTHPTIEAHKPRLLLVSPPPIEERRLEHRVKSQGYTKLNRANAITKQYADASREVAKDMNVACVDLWTAFMSKAGWRSGDPLYGSKNLPENDTIRNLIHDGKSISSRVRKILY